MIRVLRTLHRRTVAALALVLPSLLLAAVTLRPEVPPAAWVGRRLSRAAGFAGTATAPGRVVSTAAADLEIRVLRDAEGGMGLSIRPRRVLLAPDVLVYWVPAGRDGPPGEGAYLLGSLSGTSARRLRLPSPAREGAGDLLLYGLARGEVIARVEMARVLGEGR